MLEKAFYCKNGEVVFGYIHHDSITIKYRGKFYERPLSAIGKTLFEYDPVIKYNSVAKIRNIETEELICVKIYQIETEIKYYGMGGSFYGAKTKEEISTPIENNKSSKIKNISSISPLGEALINHRIDDKISVLLPSGKKEAYTIEYVYDIQE